MYDDMTAYFNRFGWSEGQAISKTVTPTTRKLKEDNQANVTGKWDFEVELDMGASGRPTFDLVQEDQTLTGAYSGRFGQADLKGTVKDGKIQFEFSIPQGDITYSGVVDSSGSMSGTADYAGQASGTWTATKQD